MNFKDTEYGDMTNKIYDYYLSRRKMNLTSLKGSPKEVGGNFNCSHNNLKSLEYSPKKINGNFYCRNNPNLKDIKNQIIKYGIKAIFYQTDEGEFEFSDIEKEFNKYKNNFEKINKRNI